MSRSVKFARAGRTGADVRPSHVSTTYLALWTRFAVCPCPGDVDAMSEARYAQRDGLAAQACESARWLAMRCMAARMKFSPLVVGMVPVQN